MSSVFLFSSCLKEDPPFDNYKVIDTADGLKTATNGVYGSLASGKYFANDFFSVANLNSGMITSGSVADQGNISALNLSPNQKNVENLWNGMYTTINRVNSILDVWENKPEEEITAADRFELAQNYFIRSYTYFNLVRYWGKVPLKLHTADVSTLNSPRELRTDVYAQIIKDANKAIQEYNATHVQILGRPGVGAVHMLLAKVYLTLYTANRDNDILNQEDVFKNLGIVEGDVLALAKEQAELADNGQYSIDGVDYGSLWLESNGNTKESIFEMQFNVENPFEGKLWNIKNSYAGRAGWARMNINPEVVDAFINANMDHEGYNKGIIEVNGGDPRYYATFRTNYTDFSKPEGKQHIQLYPEKKIGGNPKTFPSVYKYAIKNLEQTSVSTNQNMIIYRYAELKLMMAEIGFLLGEDVGGKAPIDHINDVLERARNSEGGDGVHPEPLDPANLTLEEIYHQYTYELLGEGGDWFRNRRQGSTWFKENIIDVHNGESALGVHHNKDAFFIKYPEDNLARVMLLPIPVLEINTNDAITNADQNPGY